MILCITHSNDFYTIDIVQRHLEKLGYQSFRLNSDKFAIDYQINYTLQKDGEDYCLSDTEQSIHASQIEAVWYRKLWDLIVPNELDQTYRSVFRQEYQTAQQLFINSIERIPWINNMQIDHAVGGDKLMQLKAARAAGLYIPQTLFSNDPAMIKHFYKICDTNVVAKLHGSLSKSMDGNTPFFPTTKLAASDLENLEAMAYSPMIFQKHIVKAYELRIVYVDGVFFTGKIPADGDKIDWRIVTGKPILWEQYKLPEFLGLRLTEMMNKLGLHFGAIDMIRKPNGQYVFLEVNPQGEWGMLQKHLGYPIGETIAEKLVARIKINK
ncbi:ATP-grasp ribosomal peptide maturase [Olivibacter sp. SDN3]|uniref:MvdC/MvdD family ATP grasp protein n=1 Tax=Olivibacter sp. SDN3 TaxID=2764720 RepID=UPI001650F155|nr:ATP-grasp ribosomal peptide maturase [Olivibacter sp. SDN3]QNL48840.1 ATP-grasp ribosomal peptide maturase [Olivibacter sp. SDN3]